MYVMTVIIRLTQIICNVVNANLFRINQSSNLNLGKVGMCMYYVQIMSNK